MQIKHRIENQMAVMVPFGGLAASEVSGFRDLADKLLTDPTVKHFILNFENVTTLDSSGIGALVRIHKSLMSRGSGLILCEVGQKYLDILKISGLTKIFRLFDNEMEALTSISPS